jgi:hypothetical protein
MTAFKTTALDYIPQVKDFDRAFRDFDGSSGDAPALLRDYVVSGLSTAMSALEVWCPMSAR